MYYGAVVQFYRQLLQSSLATGQSVSQNVIDSYQTQCISAAQQMGRLFRHITFDGNTTPKNWILIYWSFTASIVLLSSAAQYLQAQSNMNLDEHFQSAKSCIDVLETCAAADALAAKFLDLVRPMHNQLKAIHSRLNVKSKSSIHALLHPTSEEPASNRSGRPTQLLVSIELVEVADRLAALLKDPWGRNMEGVEGIMRKVADSNGKSSLYWFK
jgi:hypothetical protein